MKPCVLQTGPLSPKLDAEIADAFQVHPLWKEADAAAFLAANGAEFDAVATSAPVGASTELVAALPSLKVISCRGVGLEKIDLAAARARGIQVSGTFGVLTDCVADLAFGLVIDVARSLSAADRFVRAGHWIKDKYPLTRRVSGKRLGIVGLGQIGRAIAKRAGGFDMEVRYTNRAPVEGVSYAYEQSLEALARWADFLVVSVSGGPSTHHLISSKVLEALGPDGFLINVSRGTVVDQQALVAALAAGTIAGAGLDVYADEPRVPEALFALDNVVLLPHMASGTVETRRDMEDLVLANLKSFFETGKVLTPAI
ncbi:MAG: 2-hydroxyacid dehydrogenase [Rhodocyclaceae bacterium]|nr:2-hydroxyacid dehydrogenase [Rhodocyclaceae bacterium]